MGIRADESLNRFLAISSRRKLRLSPDRPWTTRQPDGDCWSVYPLYDWHVRDIWRFHALSGLPYNPVYDLMFRAGVSLAGLTEDDLAHMNTLDDVIRILAPLVDAPAASHLQGA